MRCAVSGFRHRRKRFSGRVGKIAAFQWIPVEKSADHEIDNDDWLPARRILREQIMPLPGYATNPIPQEFVLPYNVDEEGPRILLWFQSSKALPLQDADITRRAVKVPEKSILGEMKDASDAINVFEVDLDHDGIADFVRWFFTRECFKKDYKRNSRFLHVRR